MAPSIYSHNVTLEDASSGSPIFGYMFSKRRNGAPSFRLKDFRAIAPRFLTTEQLSEAQFDPAVDLPFTQTDWSVGMGGYDERLHPGKLASGYKIDTSQPGRLMLARDMVSAGTLDIAATSHRPTGFAIVGTEVWAFIGRDVYSLTFATNAWVRGVVPNATANIYRNGVSFENNVYAPAHVQATNVAGTYIYKADADANWILSTLANNQFKYMGVAGSLMYGANEPSGVNTVRTSTDPTNAGGWSGAYSVGGTDAEITALVPYGDLMLICKADGIYTLEADGTVKNQTPEFEDADQHPDNFKGAINWNGHVLLPLGAGGMVELIGDQFFDIGLTRYAPRDTHLHGRVVAMSGNATELYVMVLESGNTRYHILKAIWAEVNGANDYTWHHIARQAYTTATDDDHNALLAEGIPSGTIVHKRVWAGMSSTGSTIGPFYIPSRTDTDDVFEDADDAEAIATAFDAGLSRINKHFSTIDFETDNLATGATNHNIQVWYRLDTVGGSRAGGGTGGWTSLGTLTADQQTLTFAREVTGKILELLFLPIQGTTRTTGPELLKFTVRCQVRPASLKTLPLRLAFADGQQQQNGVADWNVQASLVQLRTWSEGAAEVVVTVPNAADMTAQRQFSMIFLPGYYTEDYVAKEHGRFPEVEVTALLAEVST